MINVNLRPGASKKAARGGTPKINPLGFLSKFKGLPTFDRLAMFTLVTWGLLAPLTGWLFVSSRARLGDLGTSIEAAVTDSTRYATMIAANRRLMARRDTIAQKVGIIQQIDGGRYVWPHILDEVSRVLPPYTWIVGISAQEADTSQKTPKFRIEGRAGNNFALTRYIADLEASLFIRAVRLASTELVRDNEKLVYSFLLEAYYEEPRPDVIQTVPLFAKTEGEVGDGN